MLPQVPAPCPPVKLQEQQAPSRPESRADEEQQGPSRPESRAGGERRQASLPHNDEQRQSDLPTVLSNLQASAVAMLGVGGTWVSGHLPLL